VFPLRGTSTTLDTAYDSFSLSIHIKFGGPRCKADCACAAPADRVIPADPGHATTGIAPQGMIR
jgi:hypothetical protein